MTRIEKHWNNELLRSWGGVIFVAMILQSFFHAIREAKLISDTYRMSSCIEYLAFESFAFTLEFLPITLFISATILQDQWKKKDYYLNALLHGLTIYKWRKLSIRNALIVLSLWIPLWFLILPSHYYSSKVNRLILINKEPKVNPDKIYMIHNNELAYIESAQDSEKILELGSREVRHVDVYKELVSDWKKRFVDFKIGVDKLSLRKKIFYLSTTEGRERSLVWSSLMRDGMYIFSLILCWIYISEDREYKMFATKRDEQDPRWIRRILQVLILYWGTQIMPLLARFFNPTGLLLGYAGAVILSIWA